MRIRCTVAAIALAVAISSGEVSAQEAPSPGSMQAARELLALLQIERIMHESIVAMLDEQIKATPDLAPLRGIMLSWATKYMSLEYTGEGMATIYAEEFTESELNELIAFYRTPLGAKVAERTPVLTRKGAEIGARISEQHLPELQRMIEEHMEASGAAPPDEI